MNEKTLITPPSPTSDASAPAGSNEPDVRTRPGRRTVEERQQAVLELFAGKSTVDQIARRLGVHASTVEGWPQDALGGVEQALRRPSSRSRSEGPIGGGPIGDDRGAPRGVPKGAARVRVQLSAARSADAVVDPTIAGFAKVGPDLGVC